MNVSTEGCWQYMPQLDPEEAYLLSSWYTQRRTGNNY